MHYLCSSRWGICICTDNGFAESSYLFVPPNTSVLMYKYNYTKMSMTAWCDQSKNTTSSIIKLRVMPAEENSWTGFKYFLQPCSIQLYTLYALLHLFSIRSIHSYYKGYNNDTQWVTRCLYSSLTILIKLTLWLYKAQAL